MIVDLAILMKRSDRTSAIKNLRDLFNDEEMKFGIVNYGSTKLFFETTQTDVMYTTMRAIMEQSPETSFLSSIEDGVSRVCQSTDSEPFVFIGEQELLEYQAGHTSCASGDLTIVNAGAPEYKQNGLGEYHLAVKKNLDAATVSKLEEALASLKESGRLDELRAKWWA